MRFLRPSNDALEVQCLVEVGGALGVDGHERDGRLVGYRELDALDDLPRLGLDGGRERLGEVQVLPDLPQGVGQEGIRIAEPGDYDALGPFEERAP